jgi:hypothetical protein
MRGAILPLLLYVFMAWFLVKQRDNLWGLICEFVLINTECYFL